MYNFNFGTLYNARIPDKKSTDIHWSVESMNIHFEQTLFGFFLLLQAAHQKGYRNAKHKFMAVFSAVQNGTPQAGDVSMYMYLRYSLEWLCPFENVSYFLFYCRGVDFSEFGRLLSPRKNCPAYWLIGEGFRDCHFVFSSIIL